MNDVEFPDLSRLHQWQKEALFDHEQRFKVLVWHRRARKTTTGVIEINRKALTVPGLYWYITPSFSEAKDTVWRGVGMLFDLIPEGVRYDKNEQDLTVFIPTADGKRSIISLKSGDRPFLLKGPNPLGVVIDETQKQKPDLWSEVIQPIMRANKGWTWFLGTPHGKNHFFDLYNLGKSGEDSEWKSFMLRASESGIIPEEQLLASKRTTSEAIYNQEWECEFLEGSGDVFRNWQECGTANASSPKPGHNYICGVDLAKHQDFTVIVVYDRADNSQVYQDRFNQIEWPFQKSRLKAIADSYNNAPVVMDATGIGDPIYDDLIRAGVGVIPFKLTNESKKDLIEKLSISFEQRRIRILPLPETFEELENFGYEMLPSGRVVYGAPSGKHDDIVIAHALANWDLTPMIVKEPQVERGRIGKHYDNLVAERENEGKDWEHQSSVTETDFFE